jgi:uncharacterized protein (TIGR04222 family)
VDSHIFRAYLIATKLIFSIRLLQQPPTHEEISVTTDATCSDLWIRIRDFSLTDPSAQVSFESKLAAECGWTLGHANVVTSEYRRFLYLTQTAGQSMCPSRDVDCAWHLHLTQTRSYRLFCESVLGRFLHHDASKEGPTELARHKGMYCATLEAYRSKFGESAPRDIWPVVEVRFGHAKPQPAESTWQLPDVLKGGKAAKLVLVVAAASTAWLANATLADLPWNSLDGIQFGVSYVLAMASVGWAFNAIRRHRSARVNGAPVVDAYEAAWLAGGQERVLGTAVASLVARGLLELSPHKKDDKITGAVCQRTSKDIDVATLDLAERTCLQAMPQGNLDFDALRRTTTAPLSSIPRRLEKAGLLLRAGEMGSSRALAALCMFALLVIGFSRFGHIFSEGRWFPSLLPLLIWLNLHLVFRLFAAAARPSVLGMKVLDDMKARHDTLKHGTLLSAQAPSPTYVGAAALVTLAFALFGTQAVMASEAFAGINFVFGEDKTNPTGHSSSTAGCGGGDGGCGGCGGCGE